MGNSISSRTAHKSLVHSQPSFCRGTIFIAQGPRYSVPILLHIREWRESYYSALHESVWVKVKVKFAL